MQSSRWVSAPRAALALALLLGCHTRTTRPAPPPAQAALGPDSNPPAEIHVWHATRHDLAHAPKRVWDDGRTVFTDRRNLLLLLGAGAYAIAAESFEDRERTFFRNHTLFGRNVQDTLGALGNGLTLFGGTLVWYLWSAASDDAQGYEASKTVFSALTVTAVASTALKGLIRDGRPNGGSHDFPSGHASQSMTMAAALDELYGRKIGWPAYALAGLVGLQRLDVEKHDTGSVLFGWVLGYVVGKTVAGKHAPRVFGLDVGLSADEESGAIGLRLSRSF